MKRLPGLWDRQRNGCRSARIDRLLTAAPVCDMAALNRLRGPAAGGGIGSIPGFLQVYNTVCPVGGGRGLVAALLFAWIGAVWSAERLELEAGRLSGPDWQLQAPRLTVQSTPQGLVLHARAHRWQTPAGEIRALRFACPHLEIFDRGDSRCQEARLALTLPRWGRLRGRLGWVTALPRWRVTLESLQVAAGGEVSGRLSGEAAGWQGRLDLHALAVAPVLDRLGWSGAGHASGRVELSGMPRRPVVRMELKTSQLDFSDSAGLRAAEALAGSVRLQLEQAGAVWSGQGRLTLSDGHLYIDPLYLEFQTAHPLTLEVRGRYRPDVGQWRLASFRLDDPDVIEIRGSGAGVGRHLERLELEWSTRRLDRAHAVLLQPWLIGTALDELQAGGGLEGGLELGPQGLRRLALQLNGVKLEDGAGRFGVEGLEGGLEWRRSGQGAPSRLGWQRAHLWRIVLGALTLQLQARGDALRIEPFEVPLLGGRLALTAFELQGLLRGMISWEGGARLIGLQLPKLSRSLGWPELPGRLDARLPQLRYAQDVLELHGRLVVSVFGGRIVMERLRLESPLGVAPVLEAQLRLEHLDLAQISSAFSFGRIQGSLEGEVRNLRLVGWVPTAFEAELRSPARDDRPHRISQKAIDDLTRLGNGVAAGVSGTFLSVFKNFSYRRLALNVQLQGDRARLDGAPGPKGGYYIVEGAGLPRVDVIGRNHEVAWKELLRRLRHIRSRGTPGVVVE